MEYFQPRFKFFLKFAEQDYSAIIKLSVQTRKSPVSQFDFLGKLNFSVAKCPHKANFTKIIYLSVQIKLNKKVQNKKDLHNANLLKLGRKDSNL